MVNQKVPFSENKRKTDIVAYLTLIGWLIAWFRGNREASRFHLNQALTILLADLGTNVVFANEYMINIDCGGKCIGLWNDTNRKLRMEAEYARLAILRLNDRAVFYSEPERPAELQKECQI